MLVILGAGNMMHDSKFCTEMKSALRKPFQQFMKVVGLIIYFPYIPERYYPQSFSSKIAIEYLRKITWKEDWM